MKIPPKAGHLYVVALPIGTISDLSFRAKEILSRVDVVATEDTRVYKLFCSSAGISSQKIVSYHDQNEKDSARELVRLLHNGQSVALVSDAGTPGVSDPGYRLVSLALAEKVPVVPIPGPSALTAALCISYVGGASHIFWGFAPKDDNEFIDKLKKVRGVVDKVVYFESPKRILSSLNILLQNLGSVNVSVIRELTKQYEEHLFGDIESVIKKLEDREPRGEFVVIADVSQIEKKNELSVREIIAKRLQAGVSRQEILAELRDEHWTRSILYDLIEEIKANLNSK